MTSVAWPILSRGPNVYIQRRHDRAAQAVAASVSALEAASRLVAQRWRRLDPLVLRRIA